MNYVYAILYGIFMLSITHFYSIHHIIFGDARANFASSIRRVQMGNIRIFFQFTFGSFFCLVSVFCSQEKWHVNCTEVHVQAAIQIYLAFKKNCTLHANLFIVFMHIVHV